jgi:hypothetical protein
MTPYGHTPTIPIHRGTLQGDTLSPFMFTIFVEPLLMWLSIGSRGYKPMQQTTQSASTYMTYDDHGYADDISITTGTLDNLQIQIKKLYIFSKYTGLELETTKCEATGALWCYGNPMSKENTTLTRSQINTTNFEDDTSIRYLPPTNHTRCLERTSNPCCISETTFNTLHKTQESYLKPSREGCYHTAEKN